MAITIHTIKTHETHSIHQKESIRHVAKPNVLIDSKTQGIVGVPLAGLKFKSLKLFVCESTLSYA